MVLTSCSPPRRSLGLHRGKAAPVTRRPEPPELPEHKPIEDMTPEKWREYARELGRATRKMLAELNRPRRERKLRAGLVRPRNQAEREIFAADWLKDVAADSHATGND